MGKNTEKIPHLTVQLVEKADDLQILVVADWEFI